MENGINLELSAVVITYGDLNCDEECQPDLKSFVVASYKDAQKLALEFITVIPDDLEYYQDLINAWPGATTLVITHQDDDTFFFSATPTFGCYADPTKDISAFTDFVAQNGAGDF